MARNILLTISYDGTDFCGWQRQDSGHVAAGTAGASVRTVQGAAVRGSGSTDDGVHGSGQGAARRQDRGGRVAAGAGAPARGVEGEAACSEGAVGREDRGERGAAGAGTRGSGRTVQESAAACTEGAMEHEDRSGRGAGGENGAEEQAGWQCEDKRERGAAWATVAPARSVEGEAACDEAAVQRQGKSGRGAGVRTVQGCIEAALERLFSQSVAVHGSGRTDSGVHANGQAANFFCPVDSIPAGNIPKALNNFLPPDIRIQAARDVAEDFSARFSATSRVYRYFILPQAVPAAASNRFVWCIKNLPDIDVLNEMAAVLRGETDCAAFAAAGDKSASTCRYIEGARFFWQSDLFSQRLLVFEIEANAFLWKMVRSITGTLIEFERCGKTAGDFAAALHSRARKNAGPTAPPQGLFLWQVKFDGVRRHV